VAATTAPTFKQRNWQQQQHATNAYGKVFAKLSMVTPLHSILATSAIFRHTRSHAMSKLKQNETETAHAHANHMFQDAKDICVITPHIRNTQEPKHCRKLKHLRKISNHAVHTTTFSLSSRIAFYVSWS